LLKVFRTVNSNPDVIVKFHKDVLMIDEETISLTVFDADSNKIIYSEARKLVDEANDVNRLVAHLLASVESERARRQVELDADAERRREQEKMVASTPAHGNKTNTLVVYSPSLELLEMLVADGKSSPSIYGVVIRQTTNEASSDVVLTEVTKNGAGILMLTSGDPKDVLHAEPIRNGGTHNAINAMSQWIHSQKWE
jgi:hypothetical protein